MWTYHDTYDPIENQKGKTTLKTKWVYRLKHEENGLFPYKARLVVKYFTQKWGTEIYETFSPVVKMSSIGMIFVHAGILNLELEQLDVKTGFLHGDLKENIYMEQPEDFNMKGKENMVLN